MWCSSANELQQNSNASSREDYIPQILTVLLEILRVYLWPLWPFVFCLSFVNYSVDQSALLTRFRTDFMSSVWNFCRWVADIPLCETSPAAKREEKRMFLQAMFGLSTKKVAVVERWSLVEVWLYPVANKFRFFFSNFVTSWILTCWLQFINLVISAVSLEEWQSFFIFAEAGSFNEILSFLWKGN